MCIDVFDKYAQVKPLKHKKVKTVLNAFIKIVNECNRKTNKLWMDQGREIYKKHSPYKDASDKEKILQKWWQR